LSFVLYNYFAMTSDSLHLDEDGNYVKSYTDTLNPIHQQVSDFSLYDPVPPNKEQRARNEAFAAESFEEMYISHSGVLEYSEEDGTVVFEEVEDAETVKQLLEESGREKASELGKHMGHLIADIHRFGAHGDAELDNFLYRDGEIFSIDHEFYTEDPGPEKIREDIRLLESDSRTLETLKYQSFIRSFREAYEQELETGENTYHDAGSTPNGGEYPRLQGLDESIQLVEGLSMTRKQHEEVEPGIVVERSLNLIKNTLGRDRV